MMSVRATIRLLPVVAILWPLTAPAAAATVPFTEDFTFDAANWFDADQANPVDWVSTGGPDGGAYVTTSYLVPDPLPPTGAILFRAQDEFGSSNGAFEGNWIVDGVNEFSFFLRHDGPAPLGVFARFSGPANSPAAVGISFAPVFPGVWTQISIPIAPNSPNLIFEGSTYEQVFSDIGHVQVGVLPEDIFIGETLAVDLDKVSIVPAPGVLAVLAAGAWRPRRRRS
ncbi:MAG: hypothetical protein ACYS0G_03130 [Planctomycetota bacterium]|jgi:hypothetical protein